MSDINKTMTVFIKQDTVLPPSLSIETEAFLPGWRIVKNLDRQALTREVERADWNFFYLAGEMTATVLGRDRSGTLRRAVKCILGRQEGQKFNSLEITRIASKRFLGIPFMSVAAHSRHIQQGIGLVPVKRMPVAKVSESGAVNGREEHLVTRQYTALISSV
jgi:hypothetical protein